MAVAFSSMGAVTLATFLALTCSIACAQSASSITDAAPSAPPSPTAEAKVAAPIGIFGDFGGARSALADRGVVFRGRLVAESAGNISGGVKTGTALASEFALGADVNLGQLNSNGLGTFHFTFTAREGSSISADTVKNIFAVQEIFGSGATPRITEASFEQPFVRTKLNLKFGRTITGNDFAASPMYWGGSLYCAYQSLATCGIPFSLPNDAGYDYYPISVWGARLKISPTPSFYAEAGAYQVAPDYATRGHGFDLGFGGTTGTYLPFEVGATSLGSRGEHLGSFRLGAYYDTSNVPSVAFQMTRFETTTSVAPTDVPDRYQRGRYGYWIQADHLISGGSGSSARGAAVFASYIFGDPQTALLTEFFNVGVELHGTFRGRDADSIAVGYAYGNVSPTLRAFESTLNSDGYKAPINGQEQMGEANYTLQVGPWLTLRPGVQYVVHPSGNAAIRNAFVIDLSTTIVF